MDNSFNITMRKIVGKHILVKHSFKKIENCALSILIETFTFLLYKFLSDVKRGTTYAKRSRTSMLDILTAIDTYGFEIPLNFQYGNSFLLDFTQSGGFSTQKEYPPIHTFKATELDIEYERRENQIKRRQDEAYLMKKKSVRIIELKQRRKILKMNFIFE